MEYQAQLALPNKETPSLILGTTLHSAILEPDTFFDLYVYGEDFGPQTSKKNKEKKAQFIADNPGKIIVPYKDIPLIESCRKALQENPVVQDIVGDSEVEVTGFASFAKHMVKGGIRLKTREDLIDSNGIIWDLKTTSDGLSDHEMMRSIYKYNYGFKAAHHMEVMKRCGLDIKGFGWIFLSTNTAKPQFAVRKCSDLMLMKCEDDWSKCLSVLSLCEKTKHYPGVPQEISIIGE